FTGFAAAARGVEREHAGRDAVELRARRLGEQLADVIPRFRVRRGIGARGSADGRLVDELHVVDQACPFERVDLSGFETVVPADVAAITIEKAVANESRLSGSGDAGDRDKLSERDRDVNAFEVVLACVADVQGGRPRRPALFDGFEDRRGLLSCTGLSGVLDRPAQLARSRSDL